MMSVTTKQIVKAAPAVMNHPPITESTPVIRYTACLLYTSKRAAQLIESGDYNMTQIAYMVGINDPRYFSKCFKQRFGMTPTEYKENAKNKR